MTLLFQESKLTSRIQADVRMKAKLSDAIEVLRHMWYRQTLHATVKHLVACISLSIVHQVDVAELYVLLILCHPRIIETLPAGNIQQLLLHTSPNRAPYS